MALGAGAGNVLTKLTKASASLFLLLCLVLAVMSGTGKRGLNERLAGAEAQPPAPPALTAPIEATDKAEDAAPSSPPAPAAPEAATSPPAVEKPAETPAAPPNGEEKK
jgi:type IV secretory pathway VirB10-like protein